MTSKQTHRTKETTTLARSRFLFRRQHDQPAAVNGPNQQQVPTLAVFTLFGCVFGRGLEGLCRVARRNNLFAVDFHDDVPNLEASLVGPTPRHDICHHSAFELARQVHELCHLGGQGLQLDPDGRISRVYGLTTGAW